MPPDAFGRLLDLLPEAVFVYRDGAILYANDACVGQLGYGAADELTTPSLALLHPDDEPKEQAPAVLRLRHQDGSYLAAQCRARPVEVGDGKAVLVTFRLLGERHDVENRFRLLLDGLPDPVAVHREGSPVYVNPALVTYLGYDEAEEIMRMNVMDVLHEDHHAEAVKRIQHMLETGEPAPRVEFKVKHRDGDILTAEVAAVPTSFAGDPAIILALRDVTLRRLVEEEVLQSARTFRTLIEQLPVPVAVSRPEHVAYVNPAMADLLGVQPNEIIGTTPDEVIAPEDRAAAQKRVAAVMRTGKASEPREVRVLRRDGDLRLVESTLLRVEWDSEPALLTIAQDITQRRALHAQLLQTDRMASIGTLAAGLAHEINNPLSYVTSNVRFAVETLGPLTKGVRKLERLSVPDQQPDEISMAARMGELLETLDEAREGADRIKNVVQDVRTFSRPDEGTSGLVDVRVILESSINMARNEIRHRARLIKEYTDVPGVEANESKLGQVFLNLLVNAAQALPVGEAKNNEIRVRTYASPYGDAVVEIQDTGPGIPKEIVDRVFEPFFTTKPAGVGTGLGLAICRNIVAAVGGDVSVVSAESGSTFRVTLPPAAEFRQRQDSTSPPARRRAYRARVLIVDDEPAVARAIRRDLAKQHEVTIVNSGRQAVELLLEDGEFDIVFCDLMMPDITGMDVFERVRSAGGDLTERFVFMTGGAFTQQAREFLASVDNICLDKPFQPDEIRELARASVSRRPDA